MTSLADTIEVRQLSEEDIPGAVALQRVCFPPPFPDELLWKASHLAVHLTRFPEGQFVAVSGSTVVASATNVIIGEAHYQAHLPWEETVGGHELTSHDPHGSTLYGVDISVHPSFRGIGLGRRLYGARFDFVRHRGLRRYATGCRIPDFAGWRSQQDPAMETKEAVRLYIEEVSMGRQSDRTLTPLLRMGLHVVGAHEAYMDDEESLNCAALLEWKP